MYGNKPEYPLISHHVSASLGTAAYHCRFFFPGLCEIARTYDFFPWSILTSLLPSMKLVYNAGDAEMRALFFWNVQSLLGDNYANLW